ncbi:hypothetical protein F2Q69_00034029 [Brassica cretica]|uniref:Uncharacterized protein n=1 Tax=Brassica cretica TaxID=69181 RepID=A0A8S9SFC0_BRACR|nr:hypothetical protein F2Q69_00034029 [Brassica cretica]
MYVFRERTTLKRWNIYRVAFMTCVFSDLIAKDYHNFCKGIKKYTMNPLYWNTIKVDCHLMEEHGCCGMSMWIGCTFLSGPIATIGSLYASFWGLEISRCLIVGVEKESRKWKLSRILSLRLSRSFSHSLRVHKHLIITLYTVSYVPMSGLN